MKKIGLLMLAICLFSFSGFAKNETKTLIENDLAIKKFKENVKSGLLKTAKAKLFIDVTFELSCCTVTFTGNTADAATQLILSGYTAELTAWLDWYACQGGYSELHPADVFV